MIFQRPERLPVMDAVMREDHPSLGIDTGVVALYGEGDEFPPAACVIIGVVTLYGQGAEFLARSLEGLTFSQDNFDKCMKKVALPSGLQS